MNTGFKPLSETQFASEKLKGFFYTRTATRPKRTKFHRGEITWADQCTHFDKLIEKHPILRQGVLTIAGQLMAEGIFVEAATKKKTDENYEQGNKAKDKIEQLNKDLKLDVALYDTAVTVAKYGSCFWEKTLNPFFTARIIPMQESIEPAVQNEVGDIVEWRQNIWGSNNANTWKKDDIIHFKWNVTTNSWPYGTSLLIGLETECEAMEELELNAKDYMENQAWPTEMLQVGDGQYVPSDDDIAKIQSQIQSHKVGEKLVTSYPIDMKAGGTGGAPIRELSVLAQFMKGNIIDGLMIPSISYQYNATQASASEMMPWALANLIRPMQRIFRVNIEEEIYKPYLMDVGFSHKTCPSLLFEPPMTHRVEDADFWLKMSQTGGCPPEIIAKEFGWEEEFKKYAEEQKKQQEQMMQQQGQFGGNKQNNVDNQDKQQQKFTELYETLRSSTSETEFTRKCIKTCEGWVKDPKGFCGAFWKDKEQYYHGPVKTDMVETVYEVRTHKRKKR